MLNHLRKPAIWKQLLAALSPAPNGGKILDLLENGAKAAGLKLDLSDYPENGRFRTMKCMVKFSRHPVSLLQSIEFIHGSGDWEFIMEDDRVVGRGHSVRSWSHHSPLSQKFGVPSCYPTHLTATQPPRVSIRASHRLAAGI